MQDSAMLTDIITHSPSRFYYSCNQRIQLYWQWWHEFRGSFDKDLKSTYQHLRRVFYILYYSIWYCIYTVQLLSVSLCYMLVAWWKYSLIFMDSIFILFHIWGPGVSHLRCLFFCQEEKFLLHGSQHSSVGHRPHWTLCLAKCVMGMICYCAHVLNIREVWRTCTRKFTKHKSLIVCKRERRILKRKKTHLQLAS